MPVEQTFRVVQSHDALESLLERIASGAEPKPDWIRLQSGCRLDRLAADDRAEVLRRLHACVLRGFRTMAPATGGKARRLAFWQSIARAGFHDFSEGGWMKAYDSPFVADYDYVRGYQDGGLEGLDAYRVYTAVLGTHDFGVEDFVGTHLCQHVQTIVEPMAGTAELSYHGHFRHPDFSYVMIDLDEDARQAVMARPWLPSTEKHYLVGDVTAAGTWAEVGGLAIGASLAHIGKQSHHLFGAKQMMDLLDVATRNVDYLMLETPQICLVSDMDETEDLTRPEMALAGFRVVLANEDGCDPNPLTNGMAFRLEARAGRERRALFTYPSWTNWSHPTLVAFAELLGLRSFYYHSAREEFVPVTDWDGEADCHDNATFMLFTRREAVPE